MRLGEALLVVGLAFANLSGTPTYRKAESVEPVVYKLQISPAQPAQREGCSPERRQREKETLNREYVISIFEYNGSIILALRNSSGDRSYDFDVGQRFTDMSNWHEGVLACYQGPVGDRVLTPECNIVISPCQKAALKEAAKQ